MIHSLLGKIGTFIGTVLISLGLWTGGIAPTPLSPTSPVEDFGAQNAVGGERYYLSGSGVSATQTTINLTKFGYTKPDGTYQTFSMVSFGDLGCGTIQPGNQKGKQEFISFTGVIQNSDNTAQLTGVTRGLERFTPYSASSTLEVSHAGGSDFVVSNSPPCFYENYANKNNTETIAGPWTFNNLPVSTLSATGSTQFTTKTYVDAVGLQGAATSTEAVGGIVRLGTGLQMASSTVITNNPLVLHTGLSTSTPGLNATSTIPITQFSGKLSSSFQDLTANYTWTGQHIFNTSNVGVATATPAVNLSVQGNSLVSGTSTAGNLVATSTLQVGETTVTSLTRFLAASTTGFTSSIGSLVYVPIATTTATIPKTGSVLVTTLFSVENGTAADGCSATIFIDNVNKDISPSARGMGVLTNPSAVLLLEQSRGFSYVATTTSGVHYFTLMGRAVTGGTCTFQFQQLSLTYLGE